MNDTPTQQAVHPMHKSYMLISTKHVDYNNLTALESVAMSLALFLSVTAATAFTLVHA